MRALLVSLLLLVLAILAVVLLGGDRMPGTAEPEPSVAKQAGSGEASLAAAASGVDDVARAEDPAPRVPISGISPIEESAPSTRSPVETRSNQIIAYPVVRGRLIHGDGTPLAEGRARARDERVQPRGFSALLETDIVTDADGRFRLTTHANGQTRGHSITFWIYGEDADLHAHVELPRPLTAETDLGDLTLTEPGLVASGTVVGVDGRAIANALVSAFRPHPDEVKSRTPRWRPIRTLLAYTDLNGRFEMRGVAPERFAIAATQRDFGPSPRIEVAPGEANVGIVLEAAGSLYVRLLLDQDIPHDLVMIDVEGGGAYGFSAPPEQTDLGDGEFRIVHLPAGDYTATVRVQERVPLHITSAISVKPGEETRDPRLDPLDLRGRLRLVTLRVRDEAGEPIDQQIRVDFRHSGDVHEDAWATDYVKRGRDVVLVTSAATLDLVLSSRGYEDLELIGYVGEREVTLVRERSEE